MGLKDFNFGSQAKWAELAIEKQRPIANTLGTIILAWLLSATLGEVIAFIIPSPTPSSKSTASTNNNTPDLSSSFDSVIDVATYAPICERNIFDSQRRTACTEETVAIEDEKVDPNAPPVKSDIKATLLGTMVSSIPAASFATILAGTEKDPQAFHIEDEFGGEAEIYDIQRNKVFFYRKSGRKEYIEVENLPAFTSAPTPTTVTGVTPTDLGIVDKSGKKVIPRKKVEELMKNMTDLLQQARMVPDYQNGQVLGFKVFAIRPGSIFEQLGLKNGDTISQINGTKIDSLEKALPMLELLKTESNIAIDINRGGAKQSINVDIN